MIIECLGKPASGKSYLVSSFCKNSKGTGINVYCPEVLKDEMTKFRKLQYATNLSVLILFSKYSRAFFRGLLNIICSPRFKYLTKKKSVVQQYCWYYGFLVEYNLKMSHDTVLLCTESIVNIAKTVFCMEPGINLDLCRTFFSKMPEEIIKRDLLIKIDIDEKQCLNAMYKRLGVTSEVVLNEETHFKYMNVKHGIDFACEVLREMKYVDDIRTFKNNYDEDSAERFLKFVLDKIKQD